MGLLDSLLLNQSRGIQASRLCETGRVFTEYNGSNFECAATAFVIAADVERRWTRREPADFYTAKHHVSELAAAAGIDLSEHDLEPVSGPGFGWQAGHSVSCGGIEKGWLARFGLVNLAMLRAHGIEGTVLAGVFAVLPERLAAPVQRPRFREFSLFPSALRDLALTVDASTQAGDVRSAVAAIAASAAGSSFSVEAVEVFDVYEGKGLPEGKKGLALSLAFRSASRTLTDDEVNGVVRVIRERVGATTPFQLRT
jgi:phenylalanyl-tRNA synthetase beta chain